MSNKNAQNVGEELAAPESLMNRQDAKIAKKGREEQAPPLRGASAQLYERACRVIPGGVNSPARAFGGVGGRPLFIARGTGCRIFDADGREYLDYLGSWGPLILGHAHPAVVEAVRSAVERGSSFGAPTELEVEMAEAVAAALPGVEMVRMVNSGTEAVMSAIRLARAYTGRRKVIKMIGGYHGHSDALLARAGSAAATLSLPDSAGVPEGTVADTILCPYNNAQAVEAALAQCPAEVACVLVEPVAGNMGVVPPQPGYLEGLRTITQHAGTLLNFDEVISGFRVGYSGAQGRYGVTPDLSTLGKIIGGGLPVGAYGGRREIMEWVAPVGPVAQAGTLSGNPLAMAAGLATLGVLAQEGVYDRLEQLGAALEAGWCEAAREAGVAVTINRVGSMLTLFFMDGPVVDWESAARSDREFFSGFFWSMLDEGVYLPPSQFEAAFVSLAHAEPEIGQAIEAAQKAMREVAGRAEWVGA